MALPRPRQPHQFIPCGEGINAALAAFTSPVSEYRADRKVCPRCKVEVRRKKATERKSKMAEKERLRKENYLRFCPWLQSEGGVQGKQAKNGRTDGHEDNAKIRVSPSETARPKERKQFGEKSADDTALHGRASKDSRIWYQDAGRSSLGFQDRGSGERRMQAGFVETAKWAGMEEATKRETATEKTVREHITEAKAAKGILAEGEVTKEKTTKGFPVHRAILAEAISHKPTVVATLKEMEKMVEDRDLKRKTGREPGSSSHTIGMMGSCQNRKEKKKEKAVEFAGDTALREKSVREAARERVLTNSKEERVKVTCLCPFQCRRHSGDQRLFAGPSR